MTIQQDHLFIDFETSSLDSATGEILEIGALRTDCRGKILATFTDKVLPTKAIDDGASNVNGYTKEKWKDAVPFGIALRSMRKAVLEGKDEKVIIVAHFADFDRAFIAAQCDREKETNPFAGRGWICTGQLVWPLIFCGILHSRKLEAVCDYFEITNQAPHTAGGDVAATAQVYWALMRRNVSAMMAEDAIHGSKYGGWLDQVQKFVTGM
jgi:DNA polymerase III epsilon subunit-like protein